MALTSDPTTSAVYGAISGATSSGPAIARFVVTAGSTAPARCPVRPLATSLRLDTAAQSGFFVEVRLSGASEANLLTHPVGARCNAPANAVIERRAKTLDAVSFEPATTFAHFVRVESGSAILTHRRFDVSSAAPPAYVAVGTSKAEPNVVAVAYDALTRSVNIVYRDTSNSSLSWTQSSDGGQSWSTPTPLTNLANAGGRLRARARGGALHVLFSDGGSLRYVCRQL